MMPSPGVLVDRPLEAVHAGGQDGEELVHDRVPLFRVDLLGERQRALHVGEQHRDRLALALQRRAFGQDAVGEMARRVVARRGCGGRAGGCVANGAPH